MMKDRGVDVVEYQNKVTYNRKVAGAIRTLANLK